MNAYIKIFIVYILCSETILCNHRRITINYSGGQNDYIFFFEEKNTKPFLTCDINADNNQFSCPSTRNSEQLYKIITDQNKTNLKNLCKTLIDNGYNLTDAGDYTWKIDLSYMHNDPNTGYSIYNWTLYKNNVKFTGTN
ncbi:hypothetical protein EBR77_03290 [bacterium]|nr:hypothetical protein [bacterium]